jgi:hypothetical protein
VGRPGGVANAHRHVPSPRHHRWMPAPPLLPPPQLLLKEHKAAVDPLNWEGWTPLALAFARGEIKIAKLLLRAKVRVVEGGARCER